MIRSSWVASERLNSLPFSSIIADPDMSVCSQGKIWKYSGGGFQKSEGCQKFL